MNYDDLLEAVKASQVATLTGMSAMIDALAKNTNSNYDDALSEIQNEIDKINNIS